MTENPHQFFHTLENLKKTKRTGWLKVGVSNSESISDHAFRMTIMALALAPQLKCNSKKLVELCLVHDLPEAICGDLLLDYSKYYSGVTGLSQQEKKEKERNAMKQLFSLPDSKTRKKFEELWNEFESGKTREAKIARELDKLEMLFQAAEYQQANNFKLPIWKPWLDSNGKSIQHPVLKKLLQELAPETEKTL